MIKIENLENGKAYIATGTDGKKYKGTAKYIENIGIVFFTIMPYGVDLIEFEEESNTKFLNK